MSINGNNLRARDYYSKLLRYKSISSKLMKFYEVVIDTENCTAILNYTYMLEIGDEIPVIKQEVVKYYKVAIEKVYSDAIMYYYAYMLHKVNSIPTNINEAIKYYQMAILLQRITML